MTAGTAIATVPPALAALLSCPVFQTWVGQLLPHFHRIAQLGLVFSQTSPSFSSSIEFMTAEHRNRVHTQERYGLAFLGRRYQKLQRELGK